MSTIDPSIGRDTDGLWAITTYFNPMRYQRRQSNYHQFRKNLKAPLLTVELAYGTDYDLRAEDAEILVHLRTRDILWQKERLLNLALQNLPSSCRNVVCVD